MMDWNGHMTTAGWIASIVWMLIIVALVVAAVLFLLSGARTRGGGDRATAREILDRRLASGELTVDEYERLRRALRDGSSGAMPPPAATGGAT